MGKLTVWDDVGSDSPVNSRQLGGLMPCALYINASKHLVHTLGRLVLSTPGICCSCEKGAGGSDIDTYHSMFCAFGTVKAPAIATMMAPIDLCELLLAANAVGGRGIGLPVLQ